jgi:Ca2+-binding EF-hand superfamily protein
MLFTAVRYRWTDETATHRRDDLQEKLQKSELFTAIDDNIDGKLQLAELKSDMLKPLRDHFAEFDADHDGALSPQEFGSAMQMVQKARQDHKSKLQEEHHLQNTALKTPLGEK